MKIGHKLILSFLLMALLIGIVGFICVAVSEHALQNAIGETSILFAQETLNEIDRNIYNRIEDFQVYSKRVIIQETVRESNIEFEQLDDLQGFIDMKDKEWVSASKEAITPFMENIIDNKLSDELRKVLKFFEEKYGSRILGEVFLTNKYGANVAQTGKTSDYYQADEEWWQVAKKDGLYIRDVEYDKSSDVYSTDIAVRIDDEDGNFLGVIKVVLNIREVINILKDLEKLEFGELLEKYKWQNHEAHEGIGFKLLTKNGSIVYSTNNLNLFEEAHRNFFSYFERIKEKTNIHYFIGEGDVSGEGRELFAYAFSKGYKDYKGLGWILVIENKTKEMFAPINNLKIVLLIVLFVTMALAIFLGLLISRSISTPIKKLTDGAIEIGQGKLDARIEIKSKNEFDVLASVFNKMASNVKSFIEREKEFIVSEAKIAAETKRAEEFSALNQQLKANEQQLKASNQQLRANEQQLKVANQQLKANEQQLQAANQQLKANEQTLLKTQEELKQKLADLELFKEITVGRESKMIELKKEVNQLLGELRREPKYDEIE